MGNSCNTVDINEVASNKSTSASHRSSILFNTFSKQTNFRKRYEYISMLGCGTFGKVRLFRDVDCKMNYAIKTLKKNFFDNHSIDSMVREVDILRKLDHPSIVKYFETYEDEHYLHIVMEYIPGDNLFKKISNRTYFTFEEKEIAEITLCLLKVVLFLHHNNIVHRDLKPDNILFAVPGVYQSLKLIDFGLAITRNSKKEEYRVGTPYYMAPEMILGNYVFESDIWSIGVILYVMITGVQPFRAKTKEKIFEKITEGKYHKTYLNEANCSFELKDLIKKTLVRDAKKRISIEAAINHPWFKLYQRSNTVKIDQPIITSIKAFQHQNLLQKEILFYLAKISNDSEVQKLKEAFAIIDKDNSGEIEYEEILTLFDEMGIKASEVSR